MIRELKAGSHFGEVALINHVKRAVTARSKGYSKLLSLKKESFERILGSIIDNPLFHDLLTLKGYEANKELKCDLESLKEQHDNGLKTLNISLK